MTGIDPDRLERRLRWAAEQLGLSPHASADEVRAAWLRWLPQEDFVPSVELRWALAALLHRQPEKSWETRADETALAAEEERLRGEVEAFAGQFWEVLPDERRCRWREWMERCAFSPTLRARLHLLESGLGVDPRVVSKDERVIELAAHVRELFVLRPGQRARVREDVLHRMEDDKKAWKVAARRLRRACPKLAVLGADLLDKITTTKPAPKRLPQRFAQPATADAGKKTPLWIIWGAVVGGVLLGFLKDGNKDSKPFPPTPPTPPTIHFPHNPFPPAKEDKKVPPEVWQKTNKIRPLTEEKVDKLIEEDLRRRERGEPGIILDKMDKKIHE